MKKLNKLFNTLMLLSCIPLLAACSYTVKMDTSASDSDLKFDKLAKTWDEGMPLGNATIGALVWQRDSMLRLSLDRVDLWDLRPMDSISGNNNRFAWVVDQVNKKDYLPVQKKYDWPYDALPAPSKIPGAALEFALNKIGEPTSVHLYLNNALCEAKWDNGVQMKTFVHATQPVGWFVFENLKDSMSINIIAPKYNKTEASQDMGPVAGLDLRRLGYEQGKTTRNGNKIVYHQKGWDDYSYDVTVQWEQKGHTLYGAWSITSSLVEDKAEQLVSESMKRGINTDYADHMKYWENYWAQSTVTVPDEVLQKQYDNEMYKFGSAAREHSYPISLQSVWTADNGKLPPWKGDYHHDLNTQLSYWPCYTGNHLTEGLGYLNSMWDQREEYKKYTKQYFEVEGLNIPGVCTLQGVPMGGWIQYSMSPTVSAWLSQHFYLHWKYSGDRNFLENRAYPFIKDVAIFLENISVVNKNGVRTLPLSSSPEIFDNSIRAWFKDITNYDLALIQFAFGAASELAEELKLTDEAKHWLELKNQLPAYDTDETGALTFAKGVPYAQSHRHFSHAMAIHPLGLIDWSEGAEAQKTITATIKKLEEFGPNYWVGYSYSWFGVMKARAMDGEGAAKELRTFAQHFCLANTFHANGDQTKSGKSLFTYRPFTLEGNFAFASGVQEMLMQSHTGIVRLFPAIPQSWTDVSFNNLRAMGAFLVSAEKKEGKIASLRIYSEQGNTLKIASPFDGDTVFVSGVETKISDSDKVLTISTNKGDWVEISAAK